MVKFKILLIVTLLLVLSKLKGQEDLSLTKPVFVVPNFHPVSCGWLVDFSVERNYCANSYFAHLDRVNRNPDYSFVISEVNNMIAMLNFQPKRFEELMRRIKEGRVEAVNGMFFELSPNLSGGEAIVRMGVNGIRWQEQILGVRPRFNWLIDVTRMNEQMAQISAGLGFEAQVYCRNNISNNLVHWAKSPDGTKLMSVVGNHYISNEWRTAQETGKLLPDSMLMTNAKLVKDGVILNIENKEVTIPEWSPYLVLQGLSDYSLPPDDEKYPSSVINQWLRLYPNSTMRVTTFSEYFDQIKPEVFSQSKEIPEIRGGWPYRYNGFWAANQRVKKRYRAAEHKLQSSEMLATISSFDSNRMYPSNDLYNAWLLLHLNTDRNTIWGAAGGMVFKSEKSWDVNDRFNWISEKLDSLNTGVLGNGNAKYLSWFNPVNRYRNDPQYVSLPKGKTIDGIPSQIVGDKLLCLPEMNSTSIGSINITDGEPSKTTKVKLPRLIRNDYYEIEIDPISGEINKICLRDSGKEILGKGGNIIIAEHAQGNKRICEHLPDRNERIEYASTRGKRASIEVERGDVAVLIKIVSSLFAKEYVTQVITVYNESPRIDFDLWLNDIPDHTLVSAVFPTNSPIKHIRRGIPFGFVEGSDPKPTKEFPSNVSGINPAIRWSDYSLENGTGFAILDRGVTGREHQGSEPRLLLTVTANKYYSYESNWLSGRGHYHFQYALMGYEKSKEVNNIARMAWEYNSQPIFNFSETSIESKPFFISSNNIILHSVHRVEDEVEFRFAECADRKGKVEFEIDLPNKEGRITNFLGKGDDVIYSDGKIFSMNVRPQQIVTVRVKSNDFVEKVIPLTDWTPLVPEGERAYLNKYDKSWVGHPPR
jgi:alpha-mannosidase